MPEEMPLEQRVELTQEQMSDHGKVCIYKILDELQEPRICENVACKGYGRNGRCEYYLPQEKIYGGD